MKTDQVDDQALKPFITRIKLPLILSCSNANQQLLPFEYLYRIEDCTAILNRIVQRWNIFHSQFRPRAIITDAIEDEIRIETIEDTFSFITFLLLLLDFHKGIYIDIRNLYSGLNLDRKLIPKYPSETKEISILRTIRHKMIAHTADIQPYKDTIANRLAYLTWYVGYWGSKQETRLRRLNTFGLTAGNERSTHVIPPTFMEMIDIAQSFIYLCEECIRKNADMLVEQIKSQRSEMYAFVGYFPKDQPMNGTKRLLSTNGQSN